VKQTKKVRVFNNDKGDWDEKDYEAYVCAECVEKEKLFCGSFLEKIKN
jgi:hypothetical protein